MKIFLFPFYLLFKILDNLGTVMDFTIDRLMDFQDWVNSYYNREGL